MMPTKHLARDKQTKMTDQNLETVYRLFTWRILSNRIPLWEFEQIKNKLESWDDWCSEWSTWAERHVKIGDDALAAGRTLTAGEAYITAGSYYHWASFLFTHDQDQFRAAFFLRFQGGTSGAETSFSR